MLLPMPNGPAPFRPARDGEKHPHTQTHKRQALAACRARTRVRGKRGCSSPRPNVRRHLVRFVPKAFMRNDARQQQPESGAAGGWAVV
ncbi:uncharacterized protein SETTUDRAFT_166557, partial [Exserohilum turcica Et28A]